MPRGAKKPSEVFAKVITRAKEQLELNAKHAEDFVHRGIRGDERAAGLARFLTDRIPSRFAIAKGEAIDYKDNRTGQLDLLIYDTHTSSPVARGEENLLIPAESLYAVIEVKTTLTQDELDMCYTHASKIRNLKPFKAKFVSARSDGKDASDSNPRCIYSVFSYFTNLGSQDWMIKEYARILKAAKKAQVAPDIIDRILVLSDGFILPAKPAGKVEQEDRQSTFFDFFLHLINFLSRESKRRDIIDWQLYGPRSSPGWVNLENKTDI